VIEIEIPGFGMVRLEHLVSDFTGTLSVDGILIPKVEASLNKLTEVLKIHILTADTFGKAQAALKDVNCELHILNGENHDVQKEVNKLGVESVVALGNGKNDRKMLKAAKIGIAVTEGEGCAVDAIMAADIHVRAALDGLDLLLNTKRCKATLRY
jgi:soluble P-type ATPase